MATFDATRPLVAATGIGVARASLELLIEMLAQQGVTIRYGLPRQKLTSVERDVIEMEMMLEFAWLLVIKAVWMADNRKNNPLEASMAKVRAGDVVTKITQKAVEIMGPIGFSRDHLLEKWFRDAKITDIYEGTGQINRLVVARHILGYRGSQSALNCHELMLFETGDDRLQRSLFLRYAEETIPQTTDASYPIPGDNLLQCLPGSAAAGRTAHSW